MHYGIFKKTEYFHVATESPMPQFPGVFFKEMYGIPSAMPYYFP
jgi:hypothetical protein